MPSYALAETQVPLSTVGWLQKPEKNLKFQKINETKKKEKIVSSQPNISDTPFDHKSPQPLEEGVLNSHRHTYRHPDIATL